MRINKEFQDGDSCTVTLKDRFKEQDEDEKLWYDRAFGHLRNIMRIKLIFRPPTSQIEPGVFNFFAQITYEMFPEMADEFDPEAFQTSELIQMEEDLDDPDLPEYFIELERPYGAYSVKMLYREVEPQPNGDPHEFKPFMDTLFEHFKNRCEPEPISAAQQKELDEQEERDNKEKEREARLAQKELEQRKAKQKVEAQMQLLKQEQNSAKLKVYFSAMDLFFHKVSRGQLAAAEAPWVERHAMASS